MELIILILFTIILILLTILFIWISVRMAIKRGRNPWVWGAVSCISPLLAWIILAIIGRTDEKEIEHQLTMEKKMIEARRAQYQTA